MNLPDRLASNIRKCKQIIEYKRKSTSDVTKAKIGKCLTGTLVIF